MPTPSPFPFSLVLLHALGAALAAAILGRFGQGGALLTVRLPRPALPQEAGAQPYARSAALA